MVKIKADFSYIIKKSGKIPKNIVKCKRKIKGGIKLKLLFATKNPAKVKSYENELKKHQIDLISIKDLSIELDIEESGKNSLENAYIKAKAYYEETKIPTLGMDVSLIIEELPPEKQIGTHIRRINGKYLSDEEEIEYFTKLAKEYGGKLTAKWVYGLVIYNENGAKEYSYSKDNFYFVDKPSNKINPGYPLDSISIIPEYNKYLVDLTKEEKEKLNKDDKEKKDLIEFIVENI